MRALVALCAIAALAWGEDKERVVTGIILDGDGRPVQGAEIAESWVFRGERRQAKGPHVTSDSRGVFRFIAAHHRDAFPLVAYSNDDHLAGVAVVSGADTMTVTITMAPATRASMRVRAGDNGGPPEAVEVAWHARLPDAQRKGPVVASAASWNGVLECTLPPGQYEWRVSDLDGVTRFGNADLTGKRTVTVPDIIIPPSFLARCLGKRLPEWTVTEARGVALKASTVASFRGKWTLIVFWACSCGPCVAGMPELIDLEGTLRDDQAVVIAFHDDSVASLEELDEKLAKIKKDSWRGRDVPFPLLLDKTGTTFRAFEIQQLPTQVLLDPEGRLVARGEVVFDTDGAVLADGPSDLLAKVLNGSLHVSPSTGRLVPSQPTGK